MTSLYDTVIKGDRGSTAERSRSAAVPIKGHNKNSYRGQRVSNKRNGIIFGSVHKDSSGGSCRPWADRRARPPIQSAHLPLETINTSRTCHPTHTMLVKQIRQ